MKSKLFFAIIALTGMSFTANAQQSKTEASVISTVKVSSFSKIAVNADVDVLLVQDDKQEPVYVQGKKSYVENLRIYVSNGTLFVNAKKQLATAHKVTVNIPVTKLNELSVNGISEVVGINPLTSDVDVTINSECKLRLQTTGNLRINSTSDYEYSYVYNSADRKKIVYVDEDLQ